MKSVTSCDSKEKTDCEIVKLIHPDSENTVCCVSAEKSSYERKDTKKKRVNRPPRAKPRRQPEIEITIENIELH